jgi:hypothetical protein
MAKKTKPAKKNRKVYDILVEAKTAEGKPLRYRDLSNTRTLDTHVDEVKGNIRSKCEYLMREADSCFSAKADLYEVKPDGTKVFLETFVDLHR